jgi:hypothetical protein
LRSLQLHYPISIRHPAYLGLLRLEYPAFSFPYHARREAVRARGYSALLSHSANLQEVDERKEVFSKRNNSLVWGACELGLVAFEIS